MTGGVQHLDGRFAQLMEFLMIVKEHVKLTSIGIKVVMLLVRMKDLLKQFLNLDDIFPNGCFGFGKAVCAESAFGTREMIGMDMRFNNEIDL
jgi:hypothetical protein